MNNIKVIYLIFLLMPFIEGCTSHSKSLNKALNMADKIKTSY